MLRVEEEEVEVGERESDAGISTRAIAGDACSACRENEVGCVMCMLEEMGGVDGVWNVRARLV